MVGTHWDISWHRSIGRDTFWTPAHIAIYLCGVLSGISCGYLILFTTFGKSPSARALRRDASVNIWGFRAPLGAFIAAWGGFAMLTSAPFDDWWHSAYGLDVKILSPPHMVLALGMVSLVEIGALILILGAMNRAQGARRSALERMFLYVAGTDRGRPAAGLARIPGARAAAHRYLLSRDVLAGPDGHRHGVARDRRTLGRDRGHRRLHGVVACADVDPATFSCAAEIGTGLFYQVHPHFVPSGFPILILIPALVLDWLWNRTEGWGAWKQSLVSGAVFLAVLFVVQWPFASFLQSAGARNWVFGSAYFDYLTGPMSYQRRYIFWRLEPTLASFAGQLGLALLCAVMTMRLGLAAGNWMRKVQR